MNSQDSQIRWLVTIFAATALALMAAAPVGAWADSPGGRQDGKGIGSIPPPEIQSLHQTSATISSNLRHEGVLAERRLGSAVTAGTVVSAMNPGVVVRDGKTFVPAMSASGESTLVEVGPNLHAASDSGRVVGSMNPGVVVRNGRTFVPGVSSTGASTLVEIRPRDVSVVPAASATSGDDGFEWSPAAVGLTAALAVALLMAVALAGVAQGKRRRVATL